MAVLRCKMCGGRLEVTDGTTVAVCEYCGTQQTLSKSTDEVMTNLFSRANDLRLQSEFDKAQEVYEKILDNDNSDAEAHWGVLLCKYGIEYVEDPKSSKRLPTCHRMRYESILTDPDYLAALDNGDASQQPVYASEALTISRLQKDILKIVKQEKPFDVFISYKETDEYGKRTQDSVIANDIYHELTQEGYKVFYSAITLEDKLGQTYEPYIFAALNSAKVMLVVGTKSEYFNAAWVKNEWSRFLSLMKENKNRTLIPCYRDMDAYSLPAEFSHLQAQDMSKIGFINDIVRGIKKLTESPLDGQKERTAPVILSGGSADTYLERAFIFLEDGDFESANEYSEKVLDIEPKNAKAYLVKLMVELKVTDQELLAKVKEPFDDNNNYEKILRFGDEQLRAAVEGYNNIIKARLKEDIYNRAERMKANASNPETYREAEKEFRRVPDYKDADAQGDECIAAAKEMTYTAVYAEALTFAEKRTIADQTKAAELFGSIVNYKDSAEREQSCRVAVTEIEQMIEQARREENKKRQQICEDNLHYTQGYQKSFVRFVLCQIVAVFTFVLTIVMVSIIGNTFGGFTAFVWFISGIAALVFLVKSIINKTKCKKVGCYDSKPKWPIAIRTYWIEHLIAFGLVIAVVIVCKSDWNKATEKYEQAVSLYNKESYSEAYEAFSEISPYKDSNDYINSDKLSEFTTTPATTDTEVITMYNERMVMQ